jgi:hypothetical protein
MTEGHREQLILERNHVVCLVILFSCQRTDLRRKGGQFARPLRPCQAKCFRARRLAQEPIPVDPEADNYLDLEELKRSNYEKLQGPEILGPPRRLVNFAPDHLQLPTTPCYFNPPPLPSSLARVPTVNGRGAVAIPRRLMHKPLCMLQLPLRFRESKSRVGTQHNASPPDPIPPSPGSRLSPLGSQLKPCERSA